MDAHQPIRWGPPKRGRVGQALAAWTPPGRTPEDTPGHIVEFADAIDDPAACRAVCRRSATGAVLVGIDLQAVLHGVRIVIRTAFLPETLFAAVDDGLVGGRRA